MGLLFSPFGRVGRLVWWVSGFFIAMAQVVLVVVALFTFKPLFQQYLAFCTQHPYPTPEQWHQEYQVALAYCGQHPAQLLPFEIAEALLIWSSIAIEIKRWHDRGMSGIWVILRGAKVITSTMGAYGPWLLAAVLIFQIVELGFCGSPYYISPGEDDQKRGGTAAKSILWGFFGGFAFLVLLVVGAIVAGGIYRAHHPSTAGHWAASPSPAPVAAAFQMTTPEPVLAAVLPESAYHGAVTTAYGHDWVIVNGTRVSGIIAANPAPRAQVALLNSDGGQDVPAASLPQGFLDDWKLTPDRLKAADSP
jgi:uncharacterized membrane protein YhaH (DUF805 family)